jgi:hypothetical protein
MVLLLVLWNWRIDRTQAHKLQQVVDSCVYKQGFIIIAKPAWNQPAETFGIVCGRAEAFHNAQITQPYEVWLP